LLLKVASASITLGGYEILQDVLGGLGTFEQRVEVAPQKECDWRLDGAVCCPAPTLIIKGGLVYVSSWRSS
jgi:hypothetical protein